jgi:hypothetical protein
MFFSIFSGQICLLLPSIAVGQTPSTDATWCNRKAATISPPNGESCRPVRLKYIREQISRPLPTRFGAVPASRRLSLLDRGSFDSSDPGHADSMLPSTR